MRLILMVLSFFVRGVVRALLEDDVIGERFADRFIQAMRKLNKDEEFKATIGQVMWGEAPSAAFQTAAVGTLHDDRFTDAVAEVIRNLTSIDPLKEAVRGQIRETLKDQHIHRAMIQGSLRALQP